MERGGAAAAPEGRCRSTWCRRSSWRWPSLPLTPNGKVDRKALPAPGAAPGAGGVRGAAQRGGGEARGDMGRGAGAGAGGGERQLLQPGRALADGDAGGVAGEGGVWSGAAAVAAVRCADGGRVGAGTVGAGGRGRGPADWAEEPRRVGEAVIRAAAAVVPGEAGARAGGLPGAAGIPAEGEAGREGTEVGAKRGCGAARGVAHEVRGRGERAAAAD